MVFSERSHYKKLYPDIACTIVTYRIIWLVLSANGCAARYQLSICPVLFVNRRKLTPVYQRFDLFTFKSVSINNGVVSIMVSSNFSFCCFRTFFLWNYRHRHYNEFSPIVDQKHILGYVITF